MQLLVFNVDETVTCLLSLHQLEAFKVTNHDPLLPVDNLLGPGRLFPLLCNLCRFPCLLDGSLAGRRANLDDIFSQMEVLEGDGAASDTTAGTIDQSPVLVDDIYDSNEFTIIRSKGNVSHTANFDKFGVHHFGCSTGKRDPPC